MSDGDAIPNGIQMGVSNDGDQKGTWLSICEGGKTISLDAGYGIHLSAENDDPTITFSFRDGRDEECHAPATDSDVSDFLGI